MQSPRRPDQPSPAPRLPLPLAATVWALAALLLLAGCAPVAAPPPPPPEQPTAAPSPTPMHHPVKPSPTVAPCADAHLTVGDLAKMDAQWQAGIEAATAQARDWRPDATLVSLKVGCEPLEDSYRWQGTFFSAAAQSFYYSDTEQTDPAEVDPGSVKQLPLDRVSFSQLHVALARAGYEDDVPLSPASGVEVRLNAPDSPFGPPGTPEGLVFHVAVEDQGQTRDYFVSATNWTLYTYQ